MKDSAASVSLTDSRGVQIRLELYLRSCTVFSMQHAPEVTHLKGKAKASHWQLCDSCHLSFVSSACVATVSEEGGGVPHNTASCALLSAFPVKKSISFLSNYITLKPQCRMFQ